MCYCVSSLAFQNCERSFYFPREILVYSVIYEVQCAVLDVCLFVVVFNSSTEICGFKKKIDLWLSNL